MGFFSRFKKSPDDPPLLQLFIDEGLLEKKEYEKVRWLLENTDLDLEDILFRFVGRQKILLMKSLLYDSKFEIADLPESTENLNEETVFCLPREKILLKGILCMNRNDGVIDVAMSDPNDESAVEAIEEATQCKVKKRYVTLMDDIRKVLKDLDERNVRQKILEDREKSDTEREAESYENHIATGMPAEALRIEAIKIGGDNMNEIFMGVRPVVDAIIKQGLKRAASDIHIEPLRDGFEVKYRIDGALTKDEVIDSIIDKTGRDKKLRENITNVIKNLSGEAGKTMRLDETGKPQDGRIYLPEIDLDLRVSIIPTILGESIAIRIHYRSIGQFSLDQLGFEPRTFKIFRKLVESPYGILFVSGPTGSGKTTTLYSVLQIINSPEKKTLSVEDPVEYSIPGTNQAQINLAKDFTFDVALRAFLRHDPDIIMVGEIRDAVTANMALEAALTGHIVLSSIHANNAVSTVTRLRDLGIDPRLITATCLATLAQRLVRRVCNNCKKPFKFSTKLYNAFESHEISYNPRKLVKGSGCEQCNNTGYHGRIGAFELLPMTYEIKELILKNADEDEIFEVAKKQGMTSLLEDSLIKVSRGITTEEEVWRVTLLEGAYEG